MNFLAHLFLSGTNQELMVGNLLEDFIVGRIEHPRNEQYSLTIKNGIQLHRLIDSFTDSHILVNNCKSVLYDKYHKYSSVLVDIFFDHFLSIHWSKYSTEPTEDFRKRVYLTFENHWSVMPEKMLPMIDSMIKHDWLKNYGEFWGIERALQGVAKRAVNVSNMEFAIHDLKFHYDLFDEKFQLFFPQLMHECQKLMDENKYDYSNMILNRG